VVFACGALLDLYLDVDAPLFALEVCLLIVFTLEPVLATLEDFPLEDDLLPVLPDPLFPTSLL